MSVIFCFFCKPDKSTTSPLESYNPSWLVETKVQFLPHSPHVKAPVWVQPESSQAPPGKVWQQLEGLRRNWVRVKSGRGGLGQRRGYEWDWRCISQTTPSEQLAPWTNQNKLYHCEIMYLYLESDVFPFKDRFRHIHQIQFVVYYILTEDFREYLISILGDHL